MYRAQCRHACSGSVMPFDLIAVNMTLVKKRRNLFAFAELEFVRSGKRSGASLHASVVVVAVCCLQQGGGFRASFACLFKKMALCCAACFYQVEDSTWTLCGTLSLP